MKTLLIALLLLTTTTPDAFLGVAENEHYITNQSQSGGYYIEEELDIHKGDTVLIVDGEVYVIDCQH